MCGSATLAIVVSSACMIVASMMETTIMPRCGGGANAAPAAAVIVRRRSRASADLTRPGSGRWWPVSISIVALMPARSGGCPARAMISSRTGMRCTTLTQLPLEFCAGSSENSAPVAALMLVTSRLPDDAGIGVDGHGRGLAGQHMGEIGLLEVGLDPEMVGLDQAEGRRARPDIVAGPQGEVR